MLYNKLSQSTKVKKKKKTKNMHLLSHSACWTAIQAWVLLAPSLSWGCNQVSPRFAVTAMLTLFLEHLSGCSQDLVVHELQAGDVPSSLPHGPVHSAAHNMSASFHQCKPSREKALRHKPVSSFNLISDIRSHHFCCILLIISKSLCSAHT